MSPGPETSTSARRRRGIRLSGLLGGGLLWLCCVGPLVGCGTAPYPGLAEQTSRLPLEAWVSVVPDSTGKIIPRVQVSVPYHALVFRHAGDRLVSGLEVLVVAERDQVQVGGGVGRAQATASSMAATRTRTPLHVSVPLSVRGDGPVRLTVTARVLETARVWQRRLTHTPQSWAAMPLWIADLRTDLEPHPAGGYQVATAADSVRLQVELQRPRDGADWPDSGLDLVSEFSGAALDEPRRQRTPVAPAVIAAADATLEQVWPVARLPFGRLRLRVLLEAEIEGQLWQLPREPSLEVLNLHVPVGQDRDWRRHLLWLDGLLTAAVRDSLREVPRPQRPEAWARIWERVGPEQRLSPEAAARQHLLRIVAADERFGGFGRGALSDRGRILIRHGEPARVETYADERIPGAMYEVWYHPAAGVRFVFYDAHGLGDYRLQQTLPLDG